jgi:hypothetical protein
MLKRIIAIPIGLFVLVITALSASAAQPVRIAAEFPDQFTRTCFNSITETYFDLVVTVPVNKEYITIFQDTPTAFRATITGHLVVTYTNAAGKSLTVNASGPGFDSFRDGTFISISTGLNAGTTLHAGRLVFRVAPDGTATFKEVGHTFLDICAALV